MKSTTESVVMDGRASSSVQSATLYIVCANVCADTRAVNSATTTVVFVLGFFDIIISLALKPPANARVSGSGVREAQRD